MLSRGSAFSNEEQKKKKPLPYWLDVQADVTKTRLYNFDRGIHYFSYFCSKTSIVVLVVLVHAFLCLSLPFSISRYHNDLLVTFLLMQEK